MAYTPKRPRGYWNSITNVKSEVDDFINANGLQPGIVPSLRDVRGADRSAHSAHDLLPVGDSVKPVSTGHALQH